MNHHLWFQFDCQIGPWPLMMDSWAEWNGKHYLERHCLGLFFKEDQRPSGLYLRSLQQRARIKIESQIALEQYP